MKCRRIMVDDSTELDMEFSIKNGYLEVIYDSDAVISLPSFYIEDGYLYINYPDQDSQVFKFEVTDSGVLQLKYDIDSLPDSIKKTKTKRTIVWFGSYGKYSDGTAKFYNLDDKHDNYATGAEGIATSLVQRLSVIQGELWYMVGQGFPLVDKNAGQAEYDGFVISTVLGHPDVTGIDNFTSSVENHVYKASLTINTIYGDVALTTSV